MEKKPINTGQWKPGQSGNPNGRPHNAELFAPIVRKLLSMSPEELREWRPKTNLELATKRQIEELIKKAEFKRFESLRDTAGEKPINRSEVDHSGKIDSDRKIDLLDSIPADRIAKLLEEE